MTVEYPGHLLKNRRQILVMCFVLMAILSLLLAARALVLPVQISTALAALAVGTFAIVHRGWRFLEKQEQQNREPTPEMEFVFSLIMTVPLGFSTFLIILLMEIPRL